MEFFQTIDFFNLNFTYLNRIRSWICNKGHKFATYLSSAYFDTARCALMVTQIEISVFVSCTKSAHPNCKNSLNNQQDLFFQQVF